jgi:hypothetical protein
MLTIKVDTKQVQQMLKDLRQGLPRVIRDSVNDTAKHVRALATSSTEGIRSKYNVKAGDLNRLIKIQPKATVSSLMAAVKATGEPIPLSLFSPRQVRSGVSVAILKGGKRTQLKGAFLATMGSGHRGVFVRAFRSRKQGKPYRQLPIRRVKEGVWAGTVYRPALPIKERVMISVPSMWESYIERHRAAGQDYLQRRIVSRAQRLIDTGK